MNIADAQRDMRFGYLGGAPGLMASGLAWLTAGVVALNASPRNAVITLFVGGMLIHPVAVLLAKALGRTGSHARTNPLGTLALEGTVLMLLCLPIAFVVSLHRAEWFFPAMLLIIGGRYLTFATLYGLRLYWICGTALALASFALFRFNSPLAFGAFAGAAIEIVFAVWVFVTVRGELG